MQCFLKGAQPFKGGAFLVLSAICVFAPLICASISLQAAPQHGLSLYGSVKYGPDFTHFDYVNPTAPKGGTLRLYAPGSFDSLNPFVIKGTPAAGLLPLHASYTFATLLAHAHDEPFSCYGYVAESIDLAPDHRSVSFTLRQGATFHDGSPITPADVIFSFETLTQKGHPLYRSYYADVDKVTSPAPRVVRFDFKVADNRELPLILGEMPLLSQAFFATYPFEKADLEPLLGSGPYKIAKVEPGRRVVYERVQDWWGKDLPIHRGQNNFDRIIYDYYRDDAVAFEAFKSDEYDMRVENVARQWATGYDDLVAKNQVRKLELSLKVPKPMMGLIYNTRRKIFEDRVVRRALALAYDFEWLNKNLFHGLYARTSSYFEGSELAATGLPTGGELAILKRFESRLPEDVFQTPYTLPKSDGSGQIRGPLSEAKKLLRQAGYQVRAGKLVHQVTGAPFTFEILATQGSSEKITTRFIANLKLLGIEANLRLVDSAQYAARLDSYDYDMIIGMMAQSLSPGNEQREFWHSKQASAPGTRNYAGIQDPVVDDLIEILNDAGTRQDLVEATRALDRVLLWGHYLIPLYHSPKILIAVHNRVDFPSAFPSYTVGLESWWSKDARKKVSQKGS